MKPIAVDLPDLWGSFIGDVMILIGIPIVEDPGKTILGIIILIGSMGDLSGTALTVMVIGVIVAVGVTFLDKLVATVSNTTA